MRAIRLTAAALVLLAAPAGLARAQAPADPVVARVGGEAVHMSDLAAAADDLPAQLRQMPQTVLYPLLLNQAIDSKALLLLAKKEKLDQDDKVRAEMRRASDQALQTALLAREIGPDVTEAAVKARYDKDIAGKPGEEEVHARHILVASEGKAREIIAELAKGGDFAELAKKYSTDRGGASGGDLGFFKRADMVPEFAAAAFALKPGEVSKEPVKSQFGWHVIEVLERRTGQPPSYQQAHDELRQKMIRESMARLLEKAHAGLKVEKFNPDGSVPGAIDTATPPPADKKP